MKYFIYVVLSVFISGCSTTKVLNGSLTSLQIKILSLAKEQTNFIRSMNLDTKIHTQRFSSPGISLSDFWFGTGDGRLSNKDGYKLFKEGISDYCVSTGGIFDAFDTEEKLKVLIDSYKNLNVLALKDEHLFIYECVDKSSKILFSIGLHYGGPERTETGSTVLKIRMASFENEDGLSKQEFRYKYTYYLEQFHRK